MRHSLSLLILLLSTLATAATKDYTVYYQNLPIKLEQADTPVIQSQRVSIADFGAVNDGQTLCTTAIQKAIDSLAEQGGGHVDIPAGIWITAPFKLKSGIDLHLDPNAIIQLTEERSAYIKEGQRKAEIGITANDAHDISITGSGIIDGNGKFWRPVKRGKVSDVEWKEYLSLGGTVSEKGDIWYPFNLKTQGNIAKTMEQQEQMRAYMVRFTNCQRVLIQGITLQNSPKFHLTTADCQDFIIDAIKVRCPWNAQNGDAIDIGTSQRVLIVNNSIDCGDDGICMKGGTGDASIGHKPCQDILIRHNKVFHGHGGFVIGSEFSAGMYKIIVCDNTFSGTDTGLRFKSAIGRGGQTGDIYCYNINMTDIKDQAIVFETTYADNAVSGTTAPGKGTKWVPDFQDINIYDINCNRCKVGIKAKGAQGMVHDITIKNVNIFYTEKATEIAPTCDIKLQNVKLTTYK